MLYFEAVSKECRHLISELMQIPALDSFRLVGGTALALQMGHRTSVDVDLFAEHSFEDGITANSRPY